MRSKEWFYGRCVALVGENNNLQGIAWRALKLGVEGVDNSRGHMNHSIGVAQKFLEDNPNILDQINQLELDAVNLGDNAHADIQQAFINWINNKHGEFGQVGNNNFGYNFDTFKSVATPRLGGRRAGGGGADNEFHIALRLVARFMQ
ncbi:hypothetical protein [Paracoccus chinensis]|uniref:hypothetical protein n=1 Tax=Paracoccus chinensis TaxID=525640 RepID=UPI0011134FD3|nr:hypothetical protein [Paracoccus chinensis]